MSESTTNPYKIANQYRKARKIAQVLVKAGVKGINFATFPTQTEFANQVLEIAGFEDASQETWALVQAIMEEEGA